MNRVKGLRIFDIILLVISDFYPYAYADDLKS
jgi:hypothetical protein